MGSTLVLLRLLYVGLTRARGDVVVTGELPARLYLDTSATCGDSVEYA